MGQEILRYCPMLRAGEIMANDFINRTWDFYNWLQGGYLHLTNTEFENLDSKLFDGFNVLSRTMKQVEQEKKEMQDLGRPDR